jgi:hypothetical protein
MKRLATIALLALSLAPAAGAATIVGTSKADRIRGTSATDFIDVVGGGRDTVTCGRGHDVVTADTSDRLAGDCETVSRRVSLDSLHANGQHQTEVEPSVAGWGNTLVGSFQVGRFFDGAAAAIGWTTSQDAGRTWRSGLLPGVTTTQRPAGPVARASDPAVAYDSVHGTWLVVTLGVSLPGLSNIAVSRSPDGVAWSPPVVVTQSTLRSLAYDKEWIGCDNSLASAFRGSCYVVYSDFVSGRLAVQTSRDGGLTWSAGVSASLDTGGEVSGALPLVQPDGSVTIVFLAGDYGLFAVRSTDGGTTWAPRVGIDAINAAVPALLRVPPLPAATVDAAGRMYVAWADCRFRAICSGTDIVLSTSDDGVHWTNAQRVPGTGFDRFIPGFAADPATPGRLGLLFYWRRNGACDPSKCLLGVSYERSDDGGATWSAPQRLNARLLRYGWLAETDGGAFFGDYAGGAFADGAFVPVFALAEPPTGSTKHEAMFATRLR